MPTMPTHTKDSKNDRTGPTSLPSGPHAQGTLHNSPSPTNSRKKHTGGTILIIIKEKEETGVRLVTSKADKVRQRTHILGIVAVGLFLRKML